MLGNIFGNTFGNKIMIYNKKIMDYCRYSTNESINKIAEKYKNKQYKVQQYEVQQYKVQPYKNEYYSTLRHSPFLIFLSLTLFLFTNLLKREIK
jgi:hypothetical protein